MAADNLVDEKKVAATLVDPNLRIVSEKLGTWDLHITMESSFNLQKKLAGVRASIPLLGRLLFDMYRLSPTFFIFFLLSNIWSGVETAFLMHMSNRLLTIVSLMLATLSSPHEHKLDWNWYSIRKYRRVQYPFRGRRTGDISGHSRSCPMVGVSYFVAFSLIIVYLIYTIAIVSLLSWKVGLSTILN